MKPKLSFSLFVFSVVTVPCVAQKPAEGAATNLKAVQQGIDLSENGRCAEALPLLKKYSALAPANKNVKLAAGLATVRCAMTMDRTDVAVDAIRILNRDFPADPDVLYVTTHAYSDLSTRASIALIRTAPGSHQARQLSAESLEAQGKWEDAANEYRAILKQEPSLPGIHFKIARCILSQQETPTTGEEAQKELEEELAIDPHNAGAEYILGELAQHANNWNGAVEHFGKAAKINPAFAEAQLGLGMALVATSKFEEAVAPLEMYTKIQPRNPAGHYQLMVAYTRTGRKEEAAREAALQKEMTQKLDEEKQRNRGVAPAQPPSR